jgi:hypothetical protein
MWAGDYTSTLDSTFNEFAHKSCRVAGIDIACLFCNLRYTEQMQSGCTECGSCSRHVETSSETCYSLFDVPSAYSEQLRLFPHTVQIHPGHAMLEGRKPALLDSLVQVGVPQCKHVCTDGVHSKLWGCLRV